MRNPEHEMFNSRQVFSYNTKSNNYSYRGVDYHLVEDFVPELYSDCMGQVGITYTSGKDKVDFTLDADDNETTLFSLNGEEWQVFRSVSQLPKALHFSVFIETLMATIQIFKGDR